MNRIVQPEWLDELPPEDPRARWSRRDLRRVNAWMGNPAIMAATLHRATKDHPPRQIVEFGAGDGRLLLRVAQQLSRRWQNVKVVLVDRHRNVTGKTLDSFAAVGWRAEAVEADVFDWLPTAAGLDVIVTNMFLHHFEEDRLKDLFNAMADRARLLVAIEPHRGLWPLFCCQWIWAIGCNAVTRHDAPISVRAGFLDRELSTLWPADKNWKFTEHRAGSFSHLFVAGKLAAVERADTSARPSAVAPEEDRRGST